MYRNGYIPIPPYFALHPPVYYSAPVGRTYGYSPFPYSGNVPTPEVIVESTVKSKIIENPHAAPMKQASEPVDQPAEDSVAEVPPQVVRNPYFEPSPLDGDIHVAKTIEN